MLPIVAELTEPEWSWASRVGIGGLQKLIERLREIEGKLCSVTLCVAPPNAEFAAMFIEVLRRQVDAILQNPKPLPALLMPAEDNFSANTARGSFGRVEFIKKLIADTAQRYGVDEALALAVAEAESNFNPRAVSPKGAIGVMQLMPSTAKALGVDPFDVEQNIDGGIRYLRSLLERFRDVKLAVAAYNAGPNAVRKHRSIPPYPETRAYVERVMRLWEGYKAGGMWRARGNGIGAVLKVPLGIFEGEGGVCDCGGHLESAGCQGLMRAGGGYPIQLQHVRCDLVEASWLGVGVSSGEALCNAGIQGGVVSHSGCSLDDEQLDQAVEGESKASLGDKLNLSDRRGAVGEMSTMDSAGLVFQQCIHIAGSKGQVQSSWHESNGVGELAQLLGGEFDRGEWEARVSESDGEHRFIAQADGRVKGVIGVRVSTRDGEVNVRIVVNDHSVRAALTLDASLLQQRLAAHGLMLRSFVVTGCSSVVHLLQGAEHLLAISKPIRSRFTETQNASEPISAISFLA